MLQRISYPNVLLSAFVLTRNTMQKWADKHPGHDMQQGDFGRHTKRTLASFSMDGKVCLVTGAARGLGNMMARTFVES